jgi:predicted AAA+ superfamily ATPase
MKRTAKAELVKWKDRPNRKPLLVTGVRQCGKTYLLKEFGGEYFPDTAYFNLEADDTLKSVFDHDFNVNRILFELGSLHRSKPIEPGKTLVILDEIQACPRAITALKYFCEEMPELHIIGAGSLLGVTIHDESISFPVGKIDRLEMVPLSFTEFAVAIGDGNFIEGITKQPLNQPLSEIYTRQMEADLKLYYVIGGMPEAVQCWINTHDLSEVEKIQDHILDDYSADFGKHAPVNDILKLRQIWDSVPIQLAKENNKFVFSHVKAGNRAKDLEDAMQWLVNAGLLIQVHLMRNPELPLSGEEDATYYKVYMSDIGLLRRKSKINYRTILMGDADFIHFKGALTENFVLTELISLGIQPSFWRSKSEAEVDFITDYEGTISPIEVKSADNTKAKSLHLFCHRYEPAQAYRFSLKNIADNMDGATKVWSIPLYCMFRLPEYIRLVWEQRS